MCYGKEKFIFGCLGDKLSLRRLKTNGVGNIKFFVSNRGGFVKPKTDKNQAENRTETKKINSKKKNESNRHCPVSVLLSISIIRNQIESKNRIKVKQRRFDIS